MELKKTTLGLQLPTDPRWTDIVSMKIEDILTDHAFCEQKAASACISLIVSYPQEKKIVEILTPVVAEEWEHFSQVVEHIKKRNLSLGVQRKDLYVHALYKLKQRGGSKNDQLVDKLLICAMIEARSCERFKLLWKHIPDVELSSFYHDLMISEAGHYHNFIQLAKEYIPDKAVQQRWEYFLLEEAKIIDSLEVSGKKIH